MRFDDNFDPRCHQDVDPTRPPNWNVNGGQGGGSREQPIESGPDPTPDEGPSQSGTDDDHMRRWGAGPLSHGYGSNYS
jgi:hypothetical protein